MRRLTETFALRLIFDSLTERDFRVWDAILHHMERACRDRDLEEVVLQDIAFHRALIRRAGQRDLLAIWQAVFVRVGGHFRRELEHYGDLVSTIFAGHRNLIEVFRSGDKQAAIAALEAHIS
ncbi:MAG: FCD domain-containing protein [Planctomycetaceae bacterium]